MLAAVGFGLAVLPICLTPGVSFTLTTQRVLTDGRRGGLLVIGGTCCGLATHALLAAAGLSALVMRSSEAFDAVKLVGAGYLIVLGASLLLRCWRGSGAAPATTVRPRRGAFRQAYLGNVLNPKAAAVYLTLAPQFLHRGSPVLPQLLQLCAAHAVVASAWLLTWTGVVSLTRRAVRTARFRRAADGVGGGVLLGLGVRTAVAR